MSSVIPPAPPALAPAAASLLRQRQRQQQLLGTFGAPAWLQHNADLTRMRDAAGAAARAEAEADEALNLKRKLAQQAAAPEITRLAADYAETIAKNQQIESACALLRVDVKRLKSTLGEEGGASGAPAAAEAADEADGDAAMET